MATTVDPKVLQATINSLASTLATLTKQEVATVLPFATQWGTQATVWGSELATAQANNDTATVTKLQNDLKMLGADAAVEAADYGINAQSAGEQTVEVLLGFVAQLAGQLVAASIASA